MTVFCKMPEEMLEQILLSLPPKSLMRFKCISKWWYAFINNPKFVAKHLSNSMHNNFSTCVILKRSVVKDTKDPKTNEIELVFSLLNFFNGNNDGEPGFLSGVDDMKIPLSMSQKTWGDSDSLRIVGYWTRDADNAGDRDFHPYISVPDYGISLKTKGDLLGIIGHCNGIICLAYPSEVLVYPSHVFLWNPAIEEFKLLPPEPYLKNWPKVRRDWSEPDWPLYLPCHRFTDALGFGYDSKSKDYKVVNIGSNGSDPVHHHHLIVHPPKAVVYTLSTDSWKEIKTDSLQTETTNFWPAYFQLYFNGMCFWLGHEQQKEIDMFDLYYEEETIKDVIIMFDMGNEVFQDILLPDVFYDIIVHDLRLLVWNKSIALFGFSSAHDSFESFGIWVMDVLGGARSAWTKLHTFELIERPLAIWKSDEILMIDKDGSIFSYNFSTNMRTYLPIQSVPEYFAKAIVYVNSIVSVSGGNKLVRREF